MDKMREAFEDEMRKSSLDTEWSEENGYYVCLKVQSFWNVLTRVNAALTPSPWIPCSERLPKPKAMCLVYCKDGIQISYFTTASKFAIDVLYGASITHWMELPEPPEVEG